MKGPNQCLTGVPESDRENGTKLKNTFPDISQENFPNLARQTNIQIQAIQRTLQRYSSRKATPRHIIVRFTKVEMKGKILRTAREKDLVTHKRKTISRSLSRNPKSQKILGGQYSTFLRKEFSTQNFISSQTKLLKRKRKSKFLYKQANAERFFSIPGMPYKST